MDPRTVIKLCTLTVWLVVFHTSSSQAHVDELVDGEAATITLGGPGGQDAVLNDNGKDYELTIYDQGVVPYLSTRSLRNGFSLAHSIPPATNRSKDRSETFVKKRLPFHRVRYCSFLMWIPEGLSAGITGHQEHDWLILAQFHQNEGMPAITLEVKPGSALEWQLVVRNSDTGSAYVADRPIRENWPVRATGQLPTGRWVAFAFEIRADPSGQNGYVKLYQDRQLVASYAGKVGYDTHESEKQVFDFRVGIYRAGDRQWPAATVYFDEMRYGDALGDVQPFAGTLVGSVGDAYVRGGSHANRNFGRADTLTVKNDANPSYDRVSLLRFNLASISRCTSAKLWLYATGSGAHQRMHAYEAVGSWHELNVTWNNGPAGVTEADARVIPVLSASDAGWYVFDLTSLVQRRIQEGEISVMMAMPNVEGQGSDRFVNFGSRESGTAPLLIVTE